MIGAEIFRRRLMAGNLGDSGYIVATYNITDVSSPTQILGISYTNDEYDLSQIKRIQIDGVSVTPSHWYQFATTGLHTVVLTMSRMFTDMEILFMGCKELDTVDLRNVDTSKVTKMIAPFSGKSTADRVNLREIIGLESISYKNVESMQGFLGWCYVTSLNFGKQDLSSVTNMTGLVQGAQQIETLTVLGPVNVEADVTDMFRFVKTNGTFYYNPAYDYSHIIAQLPSTWTAVAVNS